MAPGRASVAQRRLFSRRLYYYKFGDWQLGKLRPRPPGPVRVYSVLKWNARPGSRTSVLEVLPQVANLNPNPMISSGPGAAGGAAPAARPSLLTMIGWALTSHVTADDHLYRTC